MNDGTYFKGVDGTITNYGVKWSYGYIVGTRNIATGVDPSGLTEAVEDIVGPKLFGVWTDPFTGKVYLDEVEHVDTKTRAIELGKRWNQEAIWDLRENSAVWL